MDAYQQVIAQTRYARWIEAEERRETWEETVERYFDYMRRRFDDRKVNEQLAEAQVEVLNLEIMPSMRCLMTAGEALDRDNVAGYNCAYTPIDSIRSFDEFLYVLMCGTGMGFSVERDSIAKLPPVPSVLTQTDRVIVVSDSKIGWAEAYGRLLKYLWSGYIPKWDLSRIRPAGARLKTFGGRASGPAPLEDLFQFTVATFDGLYMPDGTPMPMTGAKGRKLNPLEVHDLCCKIAQIVVVGGVRRSALISLSNLQDDRMRHAKDGNFWDHEPQRALANNSVCYTETPDLPSFMDEWTSMYRSHSGERGIFSRVASERQATKNGRRAGGHQWGTNPCSEIILRPQQFCNLSEVVVRAGDSTERLQHKVRLAAFLGTLQSTLTDFRYLRKTWKDNCEDERLLGVSLTGIMDHKVLSNHKAHGLPEILEKLRDSAVVSNAHWAKHLGINQSAAITCVKPSGTVSQLVNSASGIHARYAPFYQRRIRADIKDPLADWLISQGVPHERDIVNDNNWVFSFPIASPKGAKVESSVKSLDMLQLWKLYQDHWCEHKPSITVHYRDEEFMEIGAWVYKNIDSISGISFLPMDDHVYQQAPYEAMDRASYDYMEACMPELDFSTYRESEDNTTSSQELACSAGVCEVVDIEAPTTETDE